MTASRPGLPTISDVYAAITCGMLLVASSYFDDHRLERLRLITVQTVVSQRMILQCTAAKACTGPVLACWLARLAARVQCCICLNRYTISHLYTGSWNHTVTPDSVGHWICQTLISMTSGQPSVITWLGMVSQPSVAVAVRLLLYCCCCRGQL